MAASLQACALDISSSVELRRRNEQPRNLNRSIAMPAAGGKPQLAPEQVEQLKEAFNLFDTDHSGSIDYREFARQVPSCR